MCCGGQQKGRCYPIVGCSGFLCENKVIPLLTTGKKCVYIKA